MACTMAMVIVLSAFNGIEALVGSLYSSFDSDLRITLKEGKTFDRTSVPKASLTGLKGVMHCTEVIEESVGLKYGNRQTIALIKGVESDFAQMSGMDSVIWEGEFLLEHQGYPYIVLGRGIQNELGIQIEYGQPPVSVYAIQRGKPLMQQGKGLKKQLEQAMHSEQIQVSGVFSINAELDTRYALVPIGFARKILNYGNSVSAIEIGLHPDANVEKIQSKVREIVGEHYDVKTRYEQNAIIFETTKTEKWITFMILSLILLIAAFNTIATLSMLLLDKKKDVNILMSLGLNRSMVRNIFFFEGILISLIGGLSGLLMGFLICGTQMIWGFVTLGGSLAEAYPIKMSAIDFLAVFSIVVTIGVLISWVPVRLLTRKQLSPTVA